MPTKKTKPAPADAPAAPAAVPTVSADSALEFLLDSQPRLMRGCENIAPCLLGHTGSGKTSRLRAYAEARGLKVEVLLLGTMLPEDILGLPRVSQDTTVWTRADWLTRVAAQPSLLLLDELDKARPEAVAPILTLLAERRVRDVTIHPESRIACAMQPVDVAGWLADETSRALAARLCFLPISYDRARLGAALGLDLGFLPSPAAPAMPILDVPSDRQVSWAVRIARDLGAARAALARAIVGGVMAAPFASELVDRALAAGGAAVTPADVVRVLAEEYARDSESRAIRRLSPQEVAGLAGEIALRGNPALLKAALVYVWLRGNADDAENYLRNAYETLRDAARNNGGVVDYLGDATPEAVRDATAAAIDTIIAVWKGEVSEGEE